MATITITWADVTALAPELAGVSVAGQAQILEEVSQAIGVDKWGGLANANSGALWLARHVATLYGKGGTGVVTEVHAGPVGKSFAGNSTMRDLESTRYGMRFLQLARAWLPRFGLA